MTAAVLPMRVAAITEEAAGVRRIRLVAPDGAPLPPFSGGAHVIVTLQDGGILRRNPYSLVSDPADAGGYEIAVQLARPSRGGSAYIHRQLAPGDTIAIGHPVNLFQPDWRARKHILVAGGIGITPFVAMTAQFARLGAAFELHYACRAREEAAFAGWLVDRFGPRVRIYASAEGQRIPLDAIVENQPLGTALYTCGPERLMDAALEAARDAGWPEEALHEERFLAPHPGKPFRVSLAKSGIEVAVGANQSLLEALEGAGVNPPYLCRGGACGECLVPVLEKTGTLLHNDHFLSQAERAEGRAIMTCLSRFEGERLVLDI